MYNKYFVASVNDIANVMPTIDVENTDIRVIRDSNLEISQWMNLKNITETQEYQGCKWR